MVLIVVLGLLYALQELQQSFTLDKSMKMDMSGESGVSFNGGKDINSTLSSFFHDGKLDIKAIIAYLMSFLMVLITTLIDFLMTKVLPYLTAGEKHQNKSEELTSKVMKSILAAFFNTSVMYYLLYKLHEDDIDPTSESGIVVKVMALVSLSALLKFVKVNVWDIINEQCFAPPPETEDPAATENVFQIELNR